MAHLHLTTIVVDDYDDAIRFFVEALDFELVEDSPERSSITGEPKRWVVVRPRGGRTGLLLARASDEAQLAAVGNQTGGRIGNFLGVDDFDAAHARMVGHGVTFVEEPRDQPYGRVAVFIDVAGNKWDLLGPPPTRPGENARPRPDSGAET